MGEVWLSKLSDHVQVSLQASRAGSMTIFFQVMSLDDNDELGTVDLLREKMGYVHNVRGLSSRVIKSSSGGGRVRRS